MEENVRTIKMRVFFMFRMKCVLIGLLLCVSSVSSVFAAQDPVLDAYVDNVFKLIEESGASSNRLEDLQRIWVDGELDATLKELDSIKTNALTKFERSLLSLKVGEIRFKEFGGSFDKLLSAKDHYGTHPYVMQYIALLGPSDIGDEIVDRYYRQFSSRTCTNIPFDYVQLCCTYLISGDESANKILHLVKEHGQSDDFAEFLCRMLLFDYNIRKEKTFAVGLYYEECLLGTMKTSVIRSIIAFSGPYKSRIIGIKKKQLNKIVECIDLAEKSKGAVLRNDAAGCAESR